MSETTPGCGKIMGQQESCGDMWPDGPMLCKPCQEIKRLQDGIRARAKVCEWRGEQLTAESLRALLDD